MIYCYMPRMYPPYGIFQVHGVICLMQLELCYSFDLDMHFMDAYALIQMSIFSTALIQQNTP